MTTTLAGFPPFSTLPPATVPVARLVAREEREEAEIDAEEEEMEPTEGENIEKGDELALPPPPAPPTPLAEMVRDEVLLSALSLDPPAS